jgi:DUF1680 family protein
LTSSTVANEYFYCATVLVAASVAYFCATGTGIVVGGYRQTGQKAKQGEGAKKLHGQLILRDTLRDTEDHIEERGHEKIFKE